MPKFLSDAAHAALQQRASNYDEVVNAIVGNSEDVNAEDVTPAMIIEAINTSGENANTDLQAQLDAALNRATAAEERATTAEQRVQELETENANLLGTAAEDAAGIEAKGGEPTGKTGDIATFADKNAGNTAAIIEQMQKEGLI